MLFYSVFSYDNTELIKLHASAFELVSAKREPLLLDLSFAEKTITTLATVTLHRYAETVSVTTHAALNRVFIRLLKRSVNYRMYRLMRSHRRGKTELSCWFLDWVRYAVGIKQNRLSKAKKNF